MSLKISIITVVFNNRETIQDTLRSVIDQDYENIEYIVIDGASTDGTIEKIAPFESQITTFISEKDKGIYDALNKGIQRATGEVIGILHADDLFAHSSVVTHVADHFLTTGTDSVYGDLTYVDREDIEHIVRHWRSGPYEKQKFLSGWMPPHPAFFVKKQCFLDFGMYDLSFKSAGDYELMLRFLYKRNVSASYLPEVLVKMRVGGTSNANLSNRIVANQQDRRAWKRNSLKPKFYTLWLKPIRKIPQYFF